jgi:UPF0176 protein
MSVQFHAKQYHYLLMAQLRNLVDRRALRDTMKKVGEARITMSFYRYIRISDPNKMRDELYLKWNTMGVLGRIYLAHEGYNAQLSVPEKNLDAFKAWLNAHEFFSQLRLNIAIEHNFSFYKLTIKVRHQIVADGLDDNAYDLKNTGEHLSAEEFNKTLEQEDITVVDMRNFYESRIGRFEKAFCPDVDTFRDQLPLVKETLKGKEDKKVLLYCTGGIRCEKASAYLKTQGFKDVAQLEGGIIYYTKKCKELGLENKFHGVNFVFDERGGERISDEVLTTCDQCQNSCDTYHNCKNLACNLLFIQCDTCKDKHNGCCSKECFEAVKLPPAEYKEYRKKMGKHYSTDIYKSRLRPRLNSFSGDSCCSL